LSGSGLPAGQFARGGKGSERGWGCALVCIALAVLAAVLPMAWLGSPDGHDFPYHMQSWIDAAQQWQQGVWLPRWATLAGFGIGQASFTFYPPLARTLGGWLLLLAPVNAAYPLYTLLVLIGAGAAMFALARRWLPGHHAVVAAVFYAVNPYMMLCVYQRSAVAEMMAGAVFPLLLLFADQLPQRRAVAGLALAFAACWISDLPAAVVASYVVSLVILVLAVARRSWRLLLCGAGAIVLGFALSAFFVLPAAYEQRWVHIEQAISADFRPESWEFTWARNEEAGWFYAIVSGLAYGISALAIVGALAALRRSRLPRAVPVVLAVTVAVCVLMLTPWAGILWTILPKLEYVQFPWRLLFVLTTVMTVLLTAALARWRWPAAAAGLLVLAVAGGLPSARYAEWHPNSAAELREEILKHRGYEADTAFLPAYADFDLLQAASSAPKVMLDEPGARVKIERWAPDAKRFTVEAATPVRATLRLLDYPGWQATVNAQPAATGHNRAGQLTLALPAGQSRAEVRFARTADHLLGDGLSLLGLVGWVVLMRRRRRDGMTSTPAAH